MVIYVGKQQASLETQRPKYHDGDYICNRCREPWDAWGVRASLRGEVSDMTLIEARRFMAGRGCPCCERRLKDAKD